MEGEIVKKSRRYNLSVIFYPQPDGQFHVTCPEIENCFTCGRTLGEAKKNIQDLIADFLPDEITSEADETAFRDGLCVRGKMYTEIEAEVTADGEVLFPLEERQTEALTKTA
jgi:predicted RNase H-like HicB family nuclease